MKGYKHLNRKQETIAQAFFLQPPSTFNSWLSEAEKWSKRKAYAMVSLCNCMVIYSFLKDLLMIYTFEISYTFHLSFFHLSTPA